MIARKWLVATLVSLLPITHGAAVALVAGWGDEPPSGPVMAFHVGDVLTYETTNGPVTYEALAPRVVRGADFAWVEALPLVYSLPAADPATTVAPMLDIQRGGLAFAVFRCVLDESVACGETVYASWQPCAFNVLGGPISTLRVEDLASGSVTVKDPDASTSWTYAVTWESATHVRLVLNAVSEARTTCFVPEEALLDVDRGLILSLKTSRGWMHLVDFQPGSGALVRIGGQPLEPARFVPLAQRTEAYPPGAGGLGHDEWKLRDAWEVARAQSPELQDFLARHPDAFITSAGDGSGESSVAFGLATTARHSWTITLLAPDRQALEVVAEKVILPGGLPQHIVRAEPVPPPDDAPDAFEPPAQVMADFAAFAERSAKEGFVWEPVPPSFFVAFEGRAQYGYARPLPGDETTDGGMAIRITTSVLIMSETGRLTGLHTDEATARRLLA